MLVSLVLYQYHHWQHLKRFKASACPANVLPTTLPKFNHIAKTPNANTETITFANVFTFLSTETLENLAATHIAMIPDKKAVVLAPLVD